MSKGRRQNSLISRQTTRNKITHRGLLVLQNRTRNQRHTRGLPRVPQLPTISTNTINTTYHGHNLGNNNLYLPSQFRIQSVRNVDTNVSTVVDKLQVHRKFSVNPSHHYVFTTLRRQGQTKYTVTRTHKRRFCHFSSINFPGPIHPLRSISTQHRIRRTVIP